MRIPIFETEFSFAFERSVLISVEQNIDLGFLKKTQIFNNFLNVFIIKI